MKSFFQKMLPHLLVVLTFAALSAIYFYPAFSGYQLRQSDITHFKGMSQEIVEYRRMYGEEPLWTNSMFGGMPAYQVSVKHSNDILGFVDKVFRLGFPRPADYLFLYFFGFYILLIACKLRPGLAAVGAVAFGLSSYFLIILEAGHNSKAHAIGYLAPILAGFIWAYRGKVLVGTSVAAFFLALQIHANHVQITYYFGFLLLAFVLAKLIEAIKSGQIAPFAKTTGLLVAGCLLAVLANSNLLYNTYQYGKSTIRGTTELTQGPDGSSNDKNTTGGLDRDYVTQWSYGIGESLTFLVPNARGGPSGLIGADSPALKGVDRAMQQNIAQSNAYWGDQPFTSGPVYIGSIIVLLFFLGAFYVKGPVKWALIITTILTLALSWGSNAMGLTNLFLDLVPGYDKFRAVTIILSITELAMPLLGFLFLKQVFDQPEILRNNLKPFYIISGTLLVALVAMVVAPESFFSFLSNQENLMISEQLNGPNAAQVLDYVEGLRAARASLFTADALRSLLFIILAAALVWAVAKAKLKPVLAIATLGILVLVDLWSVDKRYLNNEKDRGKFLSWVPANENLIAYPITPADQFILDAEGNTNPRTRDAIENAVSVYRADNDLKRSGKSAEAELNNVRFAALRFATNYRVLSLSGTFQDARTSYFHKSIGGYHGAKLKRIQEVYDFYISPEIGKIASVFEGTPSRELFDSTFALCPVLNMLNAEYIIYNPQAPPLINPHNLGSAWFVKSLEQMPNADAEIQALSGLNGSERAFVDQRFASQLEGFQPKDSLEGAIAVLEHLPNYIKYTYESPVPQATIFSEMYYSEGWNAYLDGEAVPHFRANYLLRGMIIPAGNHEVEFRFEPAGYAMASLVSLVSAVLVFLLVGGSLWQWWKSKKNELHQA